MSKFWQQLVAIWSRLEVAQKATIVLSFAGAIALLGVLSYGSTRPDLALLARDLPRAQVAEIVTYLKQNNIPYELADRDTAILVPTAERYRLLNELSQQDMLGDGSKGFELLDKGGMFQSTFSEHLTRDRAVAGELERSFKEIPGVRGARVLIDRPQPSPFVGDDEGKPRASIKLDVKTGNRLTDRQVAGIIHLTAGAVAGLDHDRVEVIDNSGLLSAKMGNGSLQQASTALEAEMTREAYLTRKGQEQLDAALGPGKARVKVSVRLDFTKRTESRVDPTKQMVLRDKTSTTDRKTPVVTQGGVAGTQPNVEGEPPAAASPPAIGSEAKEDSEKDYFVGKQTITTEDELGRIKGMTVSILLPMKTVRTPKLGADGKPTQEMDEKKEAFTPDEQKRYEALVLDAIGFNAAKGIASDGVANVDQRFSSSVQSMDLWTEPAPAAAQGAVAGLTEGMTLKDWVGIALAGIVGLGALMVARSQLSRSHQAWADAEARAKAQAEAERKKDEPEPEKLEADAAEQAKQKVMAKRQELKDAIRKRIAEDPNLAASIIKNWLHSAG